MARFLLAIDQGTTGTTALVLSEHAEVLGRATCEFPQHFPKPGWVEHDVDQIWASVLEAVAGALRDANMPADKCAAIGITNQRETTVLWDRASGRPVHHAIVWQDRRTSARCAELKREGREPLFRERTGLVLDPYFSGTKLEWMLEHCSGARARAERGELCFGTIDSWLVNRLSDGAVHVTDASNASRTLLYDIRKGSWDPELLAALHIPAGVLPQVRGNAEIYGHTRGLAILPDGIPIAGMAGDQQAALFGQTCFRPGDAKCTYGTGAFLLVNTGAQAVPSRHGLLTTVAWRIGGETTYALEGSSFVAGSAVQWLRDQLGLIRTASDIEALASQVESSEGVMFVPALTGLGAPHWDPEARGLICGLTRGSSAAHLARATLEGIGFQIAELAEAMAQDAGRPLQRLRVDGGACANALLMQFQADLLGIEIDRPALIETTALGAAYLAGLAVGVFQNVDAVSHVHRLDRSFKPALAVEERAQRMQQWRSAVRRARSHAEQ